MMAEVKQVAPRNDQPKVNTKELSRGEQSPNLTYRTQGIKNTSGRSQRDYARR
jgi:hypothetical protein